jgi:hypothetical protein
MSAPPQITIDFGLAWNWEYDQDFIQLFDRACLAAGLSVYLVGPHNLTGTVAEAQTRQRRFRWFLDRASDNDPQFLALHQQLETAGTRFINAHHHYQRAIDKANIHGELHARGLQLPLTIILPALDAEPHLDLRFVDLMPRPFVIKPSRGGGGQGVILGGMHADEVAKARTRFRNQRFLIQQRIEPQVWSGRRAWFRVYYVCGQVLPCWWDDITHRYTPFVAGDHEYVDTGELTRIARIVAEIAQLDFFSAEIALDRDGRYVVVDYVNDPCDMRLQSKHHDGVPDAMVMQIVGQLVAHVQRQVVAVAVLRQT